MAKSSCVNHPPEQMIAILRQDYLEICQSAGKGRRPYCAAMLLNMFEHWQNVKLGAIEDFERQPEDKTEKYQPTKWIYFTESAMAQEQLLGMFGVSMVSECIDWLVEQEYILTRSNPKYGYDRTKQFTLNINKIRNELSNISEKQRMHSLNLTNGIVESNEAIPKVSTKVSLKDSLGSENPDPRCETDSESDLVQKAKEIRTKRSNHTVEPTPIFRGHAEVKANESAYFPEAPTMVGGIDLSSEQIVEPNQSSAAAPDGWQRIDDLGIICCECANHAAWEHNERVYCEWHYAELTQGVEVSGVSEKPKRKPRKRKGKQLANDQVVDALVIEFKYTAPTNSDYNNLRGVAKELLEVGLTHEDIAGLKKSVDAESKNEGDWKVTARSLLGNGRVGRYINRRDIPAAKGYSPMADESVWGEPDDSPIVPGSYEMAQKEIKEMADEFRRRNEE